MDLRKARTAMRLQKYKLKPSGTVKELEWLKNPFPPGSHSCHGTVQMQMWYRIAKSPVLKLELARHCTDALLAFQSFRPRMQHESYCPLQSRSTKPCSLGSQKRLNPLNIAERLHCGFIPNWAIAHGAKKTHFWGNWLYYIRLQFKDKQWK